MAINLVKGQRVEIGLQKLGVGLGWDPNPNASSHDYDLDASAFMIGQDSQVPNENFFVFYGNQESPDGAVKSSGDDRTGGNSDGDDETLEVDLGRLDPRIDQIVFTVSIYEAELRRQNFGQVRNSFIRIYNALTNEELCKYELEEDFSIETALEFGRLYKRNDSWKFEAMGAAAQNGLDGLVKKYARAFSS
ncbi:MAG: TerD family protein [Verrucomicrobiales bacterium]|nr:TerD family protein [Verrucomicrobiales bacterium]